MNSGETGLKLLIDNFFKEFVHFTLESKTAQKFNSRWLQMILLILKMSYIINRVQIIDNVRKMRSIFKECK